MAHCDELRRDRQRGLPGRPAAEIQSDRSDDPGQCLLADAPLTQPLQPCGVRAARAERANEPRAAGHRGAQRHIVDRRVVGERDHRVGLAERREARDRLLRPAEQQLVGTLDRGVGRDGLARIDHDRAHAERRREVAERAGDRASTDEHHAADGRHRQRARSTGIRDALGRLGTVGRRDRSDGESQPRGQSLARAPPRRPPARQRGGRRPRPAPTRRCRRRTAAPHR